MRSSGCGLRRPTACGSRTRARYIADRDRAAVAVIVAHPAGGAYFLRREMLYTAVTRAKLATVIVGARASSRGPRARPTPAAATAAWPSGSADRELDRVADADQPVVLVVGL